MPNIASVLKAEISRLARKESKQATNVLKRAVNTHRAEIAGLKRRIADLERSLRRATRNRPAEKPGIEGEEAHIKVRFSAKGLAAQRKRLGLSAHDIGLLLGTTGQSIYNWEAGKARPRSSYMPAIVALRSLGRRQAQTVLAERR